MVWERLNWYFRVILVNNFEICRGAAFRSYAAYLQSGLISILVLPDYQRAKQTSSPAWHESHTHIFSSGPRRLSLQPFFKSQITALTMMNAESIMNPIVVYSLVRTWINFKWSYMIYKKLFNVNQNCTPNRANWPPNECLRLHGEFSSPWKTILWRSFLGAALSTVVI